MFKAEHVSKPEQALLHGCVGGGGASQASCLVAKQAVEFPQILASKALFDCMQKMDHPTPQYII